MHRKRGWKKVIQDRARSILNATPIGDPIRDEADDAFLRDVVALHPEAAAKIGCGIDHFEVRANEWGGRTFWLVRIDDTATDFSFLKALTPPTPMQDFARACRAAVIGQILTFKNSVFDRRPVGTMCPITGELVDRDTCHIDHAPPWTFDAIVRLFAEGRDDITADVEPTRDGDLSTHFRDPATAELFAEFHRDRATLRAVSRRANLSVLRRRTRDV